MKEDEVSERLRQGQKHLIRLKVPPKKIIAKDLNYGSITFTHETIEDQLLFSLDGQPTSFFANAIDDYLMRITHIIRSEVLQHHPPSFTTTSSLPLRRKLLAHSQNTSSSMSISTHRHTYNNNFRALGIVPPQFVHLPTIANVPLYQVHHPEPFLR
jgi:glutamyl/glutaminyl-tRNA synthetase